MKYLFTLFCLVSAYGGCESRVRAESPYDNSKLMAWARGVIEREFPNDDGGYYDICDKHAMHVKTADHRMYDNGKVSGGWDLESDMIPVALSVSYEDKPELVNACALILNGAED